MIRRPATSLEILFEDNHLIAVNKACGDIVQPDISEDISLEERVKDYIRGKYKKPGNVFLGVAHRLDRPVSGVVMFARTSKALTRINEMFRGKCIKKTYWAVVRSKPEQQEATLRHYILRNSKQNKSFAHEKQVPGSKLAVLHYKLLAGSDNYYLLEVDLETGRHHQIRCQLSAIGCPIRGDLKYGFNRSNPDGGISLHARSIRFEHPVKEESICIIAPPPGEKLWDVFIKCL